MRRKNVRKWKTFMYVCIFSLVTSIAFFTLIQVVKGSQSTSAVSGEMYETGIAVAENFLTEQVNVIFSDAETIYLTDTLEESDLFVVEKNDDYTYVLEPAIDELEEGTQTITITVTDALGNSYEASQTFEFAEVAIAIEYDFEGMTAEEVLKDFMIEKGLNEDEFAVFYYNTNTEEEYIYNGEITFTAASTIKVPLNLLYYDMIASGEMTEDSTLTYDSSSTATGAGSTAYDYAPGSQIPLSYLLEQSIVYSDNTATNILISGLGQTKYRYMIVEYSDEELPEEFYFANLTTSAFAYDVMRYLYDNSEKYPELLENMKLAAAGEYLELDFDYYSVAHKYGSYDGYVHDYGIVYTPTPYLIGVFTNNVADADEIISELNLLFLQYTLSEHGQ